ncbi:MAG: hypothetical protein Q8M40_11750 [Legionella sp.]|nr:hypothetical protein [Legionella sp.]
MEQKIERMSNWHQFNNHKSYHPDWGDKPIIELFNPDLEEGTYYLTRHYHQYYCVFYQVRNPQNEKNQQLWVESIQFSLTDDSVQVKEHDEYRLIVKGEHSFSWGDYQEQQSEFHLNIARRADKRVFGSFIDFLASTPCKKDAPSDLKYKRINNDYDTNIKYHYFDYQKIASSVANHDSSLDSVPTEVGLNINRRLDWSVSDQAQSASRHGFNFFQDKPFNVPGYYSHWGERVVYELFNPELKEGTFYFTRVDDEYRLYIQKRNQDLGYNKTIWVECQHLTLHRGTVSVTQTDELRLIYEDHDGCSYDFDEFKDYGCGNDLIGIASKNVTVNYNSLESYLQQFLPEYAAPKNLRLKRTADGYSLRKPDFCKISSVCEEYDRKCVSHNSI